MSSVCLKAIDDIISLTPAIQSDVHLLLFLLLASKAELHLTRKPGCFAVHSPYGEDAKCYFLTLLGVLLLLTCLYHSEMNCTV